MHRLKKKVKRDRRHKRYESYNKKGRLENYWGILAESYLCNEIERHVALMWVIDCIVMCHYSAFVYLDIYIQSLYISYTSDSPLVS